MSPDAVRFCAYGAILRAAYDVTGDFHQARRLVGQLEAKVTGGHVRARHRRRLCHVNDEQGYVAALRLLDDAHATMS